MQNYASRRYTFHCSNVEWTRPLLYQVITCAESKEIETTDIFFASNDPSEGIRLHRPFCREGFPGGFFRDGNSLGGMRSNGRGKEKNWAREEGGRGIPCSSRVHFPLFLRFEYLPRRL